MAVDGLAIGGLVPRVKRDPQQVIAILEGVRAVTDKPLHAFGHPRMVDVLRQRGVTSFDSSSPMRAAASGITWGGGTLTCRCRTAGALACRDRENIASLTGIKVPAVAVRLPESSPRLPSVRAH